MGEFNSDDNYIYYRVQESLRRNGVAVIVNKRVLNVVLGCNLKNDRMISVHLQGKPFIITVTQVYALSPMPKKLMLISAMKTQKTSQNKHQKRYPIHHKGWDAKVGSQEIPGVIGKFGLGVQNEAGQRLTEFCQRMDWSQQTPSSNHRRDNYMWTSSDGQY